MIGSNAKTLILNEGVYDNFGWSQFITNTVYAKHNNFTYPLESITLRYDITNESQALDAILNAGYSREYKCIISTNIVHSISITKGAELFSDIIFIKTVNLVPGIVVDTIQDHTNMIYIEWANLDLFYLSGIFAALTTKTQNVGFVHPGIEFSSVADVNAFFMGVNLINPNTNVHVSFIDQHVENSDILEHRVLNQLVDVYLVDIIATSADDYSIHKYAYERNMSIVSNTGYPLATIFGSSVKLVSNFDIAYIFEQITNLFNLIESKSFELNSTQRTISLGYNNTNTFSVSIDKDIAPNNELDNAIQYLTKGNKPYFCNEYIREFGFVNLTTGCLINPISFFNNIHSKVIDHGYFTKNITRHRPPVYGSTLKSIVVISIIGMIFSVFVILFIFFARYSSIVRAGSPKFLALLCCSCFMIYVGIMMWGTRPLNDRVCAARFWIPSIGFTAKYVSLIVKNIRIWKLLVTANNLNTISKKTAAKLSNKFLIPCTFFFIALDIVILAVYQSLGNPHVEERLVVSTFDTEVYTDRCVTNAYGVTMYYVILGYHALQLISLVIISLMTGDVPLDIFNESKAMATMVYCAIVCCMCASVLFGISNNRTEEAFVILVGFTLFMINTVDLVSIFAPKILYLWSNGMEKKKALASTKKAERIKPTDEDQDKDSESQDSDIIEGYDIIQEEVNKIRPK